MLTIEHNYITYNINITIEYDELIIDVEDTLNGARHNTSLLMDTGLDVSEAITEFISGL